jgi:hypothetical protein
MHHTILQALGFAFGLSALLTVFAYLICRNTPETPVDDEHFNGEDEEY